MVEVRLEGLSKRYGEVQALAPCDLTIGAGEFFSLLGPSGCGKTTTLRLVAGLEHATSGRLWFGEQEVTGLPTHLRGIGMVFQNYALFPHLNVAGNVAYGLRARGQRGPGVAQRAELALTSVALQGFGQRKVSQLSGGQQQRVAVARALALEPDLLLLDEPLSNLDAALREETRAELRRLQQVAGATAIYVTHDQEEALALSDRLAVLRDGVVQQVGTPREVYTAPANAFVATFLGRANLAPVTVVHNDGRQWRASLTDGSLVHGATPSPLQPGEPGTLCVRPEQLVAGSAGLPARIESVAYLGPTSEVRLRVADEQWTLRHTNYSQISFAPGTLTMVSWPSEEARLLPRSELDEDLA